MYKEKLDTRTQLEDIEGRQWLVSEDMASL